MCEKTGMLRRLEELNEGLRNENELLKTRLMNITKTYDELKIEQQKDKALWLAMCTPKERTEHESNSPT